MKIYTYAVINYNGDIDKSIKGLEERSVYNIPYEDIGIVASNINEKIEEIKDITKEYVLAHEKVVEELMDKFTVLPVRFFTVFDKKENVISMTKNYYNDFKSNLIRLGNKVEFGIKVIWNGSNVKKKIEETYKNNDSIPATSSAKIFIKEKFKEYKINKIFESEAERCIEFIDNSFNRFSCEKKIQKLKTENLLLEACYLVEKEKQNDFKKVYEQFKNVQNEFKYLFSGPWPAYNFISGVRSRSAGCDLRFANEKEDSPGVPNLLGRTVPVVGD